MTTDISVGNVAAIAVFCFLFGIWITCMAWMGFFSERNSDSNSSVDIQD